MENQANESKKPEGRVYCLKNPMDNNSIFYVGQTLCPMKQRLQGHIKESRKKKSVKSDIISEIILNNKNVIIEELEYFTGNKYAEFTSILNERELFHIKELAPIANVRDVFIKTVCGNCGKEFPAKTSRARFCSDYCRVTYNRHIKELNGGILPEKTKPVINSTKTREISLNHAQMEQIAEAFVKVWQAKMNIQSATIKKVEEKSVAVFDVEVEDYIKEMSYNDYLDVIPKLKSIDECERLDAEIKKLNFAAWQKVELSKRIKLRSQHPDLN